MLKVKRTKDLQNGWRRGAFDVHIRTLIPTSALNNVFGLGLVDDNARRNSLLFCAMIILTPVILWCRSQWPRGLRRGSAAARLLGLWVRIPPGAWMCV